MKNKIFVLEILVKQEDCSYGMVDNPWFNTLNEMFDYMIKTFSNIKDMNKIHETEEETFYEIKVDDIFSTGKVIIKGDKL